MELAGIPIWIWGGFLTFVLGMLALDLGVFHKDAHEVDMKEALTWSAIWIAVALAFNAGIYAFWNVIQPGSAYTPAQAGQAFLAGYLVEKALSVDNIFVFLMVFAYFKVPALYQHRVLFWGIVGALIFRALFIAAGAAILEKWFWTMIVFGGFLIFTGVKMLIVADKQIDPDKNPAVKLVRKFFPVTPDYVGQKFFTRIDGKLWATPLFVALVMIEFTDVIFAVDSIPAIFAITSDPFIVFTSNVFAILGLRALFFAIAGLVKLFAYLKYGLSAILIFVGGKMLFNYFEKTQDFIPEVSKFPIGLSLVIIAGILTLSIVASLLFPPKKNPHGDHLDSSGAE
jgi:tellurite resistance protein TerC